MKYVEVGNDMPSVKNQKTLIELIAAAKDEFINFYDDLAWTAA